MSSFTVSSGLFVLLTAIIATRTTTTRADNFGREVVAVARATSPAIGSRLLPVQSALETLSRSRILARDAGYL